MKIRLAHTCTTVLAMLLLGASAALALEPAEVAVLYNPKSDASEKIARHYIAARNIPESNLIPVETTPDERISEEMYRKAFLPSVQKTITDRKLKDKLKFLVTTRGIPLIIGPQQPSPEEQRELAGYRKKSAELLALLQKTIDDYDAIAQPAGTQPTTTSRPATRPNEPVLTSQRLLPVLAQAASAAARRTQKIEGPDQQKAFDQLVSVHERAFGLRGLLDTFAVNSAVPGSEKAASTQEEKRKQLRSLEEEANKIAINITDPAARQKLLILRGKTHGIVGMSNQVQANIDLLSKPDSDACLDSELMLIWDDPAYPRARWGLNSRNVEQYNPARAKVDPAILPVSRLDGWDVKQVTDMIDTGIEVEKKGLEGIMYIDARGLNGNDSYSAYDKDLRRAAEYLEQNSTQKIVLDNNPALLKSENAPDAALYVGWYSVHSYQDSCKWLPGAVGYHIASWEMTTLRDPKDKGWVPNLLARGFAGTCGPVNEPYLNSFPKASIFFPLLLSGEFTQGEVWLLSCPWISWRVGFIGDPLYNPFKANSKLTSEKIQQHPQLRRAYEILGRPKPAASSPARPTPSDN